jgi:hypothetical protein
MTLLAQTNSETVYVDDKGVMRWRENNEEIQGFGVNYTMPFAHAYRSAKKLGKDPLEAIDEDIHHFKRLGFDLYRVHVWDTEISDTLGNLIYNEHLHAFDYLLHKLRSNDIYYVLTPIAFWGNGWPEPDEKTPGFSAKYGKNNCLTDDEAIKAQENYLTQFMSHVNPYTGLSYKDDPYLIAMEISNEPHHRGTPESVTEFVQFMVNAVRKSGYKNPIFYNVSHSVHLMENYFDADIQGGTFQWYPTGLGYQKPLPGNFLPNVDKYLIPFDSVFIQRGKAKLVYEFDGADIHNSYIYPAMARSFRTAGIQIATHFAYDPMILAHANTEYNTHYMNLAYTPGKALALAISSKVFHEMPMYESYGSYPENRSFGNVTIDEQSDVVIYDSGTHFIYTNHTETEPKTPSKLNKIAGVGNSSVITYNGTGAYFLDKVELGKWRLEVMPDILTYQNPYGRNSLEKRVTAVQYNERLMEISLPELGNSFTLKGINSGNNSTKYSEDGALLVKPGVYLLEIGNTLQNESPYPDKLDGLAFDKYYAPAESTEDLILKHQPLKELRSGQSPTITMELLSRKNIDKVELLYRTGWRWNSVKMDLTSGFEYKADLDLTNEEEGTLEYYIVVYDQSNVTTFPPKISGLPFQWDFYDRSPYRVKIVNEKVPIMLYNAEKDFSDLSYRWQQGVRNVAEFLPGNTASFFPIKELYRPDSENLNGNKIYDYTIRHYLEGKIEANSLAGKSKLVIEAKSLEKYKIPLQIALVDKYGNAFGAIVKTEMDYKTFEIKLKDLKPVALVTMPRPYPTFLPYFYQTAQNATFDIMDIQSLQISVGPGLNDSEKKKSQGFALKYIFLEK